MDAAEMARKFAEAAQRLPDAVQRAETLSLTALRDAAVDRSQGPLQAKDERRLGHPYARRRLKLNPNVINRWTGGFADAWKTEPPKLKGGTFTATLYNDSLQAAGLEAGLVFGEPVMEPREPHLDAYEEIRAERERRLGSVWDELFP